MYNYDTPENAIKSLETAYTNHDLDAIINSKDFLNEAKFILQSVSPKYDLEDKELVSETAKSLELRMILSMQNNGFPDFSILKSDIYGLQRFNNDIYVVNERLTYPDGSIYETRIFLSFINDIWKIALIEE